MRLALHATRVVGCALASLVGCGAEGDPGAMPSARQIDVQASRPAPRPWITGRSTKPKSTENANTERIATLAHRRQGRSRGSGASLTFPALVDAVHQRLRRLEDEELGE